MQRFLRIIFAIMKEFERIRQVMEAEKMSAKQFAQEVGIQSGTISNIMSGRNNPSLDVMQRVLNRFRTLSSDWLILGVGSMYRANGEGPDNTLFDIKPVDQSPKTPVESAVSNVSQVSVDVPKLPLASQKLISKIVIFYNDGTFEER